MRFVKRDGGGKGAGGNRKDDLGSGPPRPAGQQRRPVTSPVPTNAGNDPHGRSADQSGSPRTRAPVQSFQNRALGPPRARPRGSRGAECTGRSVEPPARTIGPWQGRAWSRANPAIWRSRAPGLCSTALWPSPWSPRSRCSGRVVAGRPAPGCPRGARPWRPPNCSETTVLTAASFARAAATAGGGPPTT